MEDRTLHNRIVQRIVRESNTPELMEVLTERISMTDLHGDREVPNLFQEIRARFQQCQVEEVYKLRR